MKTVDCGIGSVQSIEFPVIITNENSPWAAVAVPDGDMSRKAELTGTVAGR